ncbi:hypothetical protein N802_01895 [Knoellia sinensis KCTC 19936]|uniref:N-acetyltransferase domain-containing protein n=1 Tax=Knoellia sinensis KCTC 19936 TaxID=1385520 RepID=A0A0A0JDC9_9MICO|nr:hypothetical protein [Knoellia sinensis]KGN34824.1 hypothetical protein N802_01895 [Knoellia sinensis KCTC 19936]
MSWLDALGWFGSALLVFSLLQARILRLRILNTIACLILTVFNAAIGVWPMVAMNVVLAAINLFFIARMLRERNDETAFRVIEVEEDDAYLQNFLEVEGAEIGKYNPGFSGVTESSSRFAYLVVHGHETVGVVVVRDAGGGVGQVELDYVTERYRDFTPGEFVWRHSGLFAGQGWRTIRTPDAMVGAYYEKLGFRRDGQAWALDIAAVTRPTEGDVADPA